MSDIKTSKERIAYRVSQGGHNIPVDIIERRYNKSFNNLYDNYNLFDEIYFYDNLNQYHKLIGYYNNELEVLDSTSKWSSTLKDKIKNVIWTSQGKVDN